VLFNSFEFAIFLPIVFLLYWLVAKRSIQLQNVLIVAVSYVFYGWWDWRFLGLIIFSSFVDFFIGKQLGKAVEHRKRWLWMSLAINLGLLGFFKYCDFFIAEFIAAFASVGIEMQASSLRIILPVGISFYTFQTLSYTIDVYRKKLNPVQDWTVFFAYVSFFPQLVAGPIERATQLIPQFQAKRVFDYEKAKDGTRQILWGLFKKVVIADSCASVVNRTFENYEALGTGALALGAVLFAIQIYCDFSGYSDIAIGTARLFGFNLMRNFSYPYFARNIGEFWRKWHISLSTWFRDYLYIPLGGSRVESKAKLVRNIFAIFLVSGFWHGANWTFLVWGGLHALFFLPSILLQKNRKYLNPIAMQRWLPTIRELSQILLTFGLVTFAWIFFRAESVSHALDYITQMATNLELNPRVFRKNWLLLMGIALMLIVEWLQRNKQYGLELDDVKIPVFIRGAIYMITAMAIVLFASQEDTTFIYFQF